MSKGKQSFSSIVSNSQAVREAFSIHAPTRSWWNLILKLHGKPIDQQLPPDVRLQCIAEGFKFYASLYRLLAVIFFLLAPSFVWLDVSAAIHASAYWGAASFLVGSYLWIVSGLGYAGSQSYRLYHPQSIQALISFMVMIVAFLSMFVAVLSVVIHQQGAIATWPNLVGATLLFVFGIGSYMIEIIYLTTENHFEA